MIKEMKRYMIGWLLYVVVLSSTSINNDANNIIDNIIDNITCNYAIAADDPAPVPLPNPPNPDNNIPTISIPKELTGDVGSFVEIKAVTNGQIVKWAVLNQQGLNLFPMDLLKDTTTAVAVANKEGIFYLHAWTALNNVPSELVTCKITIGNPPQPIPPQPIPPQPNPPQPNPPQPTKLSVLFVDEANDYGTAAYKPYLTILNSSDVRAYLNSHTATSSDGIQEWRRWDKDTDISHESTKWKALFSSPRDNTNLPWLIIADSDGKILSSAKVPSTTADTLTLLKKYGGS